MEIYEVTHFIVEKGKGMGKKYYFKNLLNGLTTAIMLIIAMYFYPSFPMSYAVPVLLSCALLMPFSKKMIEDIALRYTSEEFWNTGIFKDDIGKNGLYAMFYLLCFILAIPLGLIYILVSFSKKNPTTTMKK
ncbi:colicin E1 immunity protein [Serratia sp. JUb9]|uniref:colicin E1 immunity protein n=1 Tax=Serratia sp. JUb9 TaxID=2724469 RepID=UPI001C9AECE8|nr:colicin E1 immunity protein [Serratia sp. JUb9]